MRSITATISISTGFRHFYFDDLYLARRESATRYIFTKREFVSLSFFLSLYLFLSLSFSSVWDINFRDLSFSPSLSHSLPSFSPFSLSLFLSDFSFSRSYYTCSVPLSLSRTIPHGPAPEFSGIFHGRGVASSSSNRRTDETVLVALTP